MSDAFDILVFGSAIVDFISYVPRLPKPGETIHGTKFATGYGGKGANQCVAGAKLGARTAFIGYLGTDSWGDKYLENFKAENVDTFFVERVDEEPTGIAQICVADNGENQIVIITGANKTLGPQNVLKAMDYMENSKVLLCQLETPLNGTIEALKSFRGISILNTAPALDKTPLELIRSPSILCANETEATLMTGVQIEDLSDAQNAINELVKMGSKSVILTLGEKGALYSMENNRQIIHVEATKVDRVVDTTGAGDAFIGSLAYFLAKHPDMEMHQKIGSACYVAAFSVQRPGTQSSFPKATDLSIDFTKTSFKWKVLKT